MDIKDVCKRQLESRISLVPNDQPSHCRPAKYSLLMYGPSCQKSSTNGTDCYINGSTVNSILDDININLPIED